MSGKPCWLSGAELGVTGRYPLMQGSPPPSHQKAPRRLGVLRRISSMLAPSPSALRLCLCQRGPNPHPWASVLSSPSLPGPVDTRARAGASEDVTLPSPRAPFPHPTW